LQFAVSNKESRSGTAGAGGETLRAVTR
jgi:hypothetical protein